MKVISWCFILAFLSANGCCKAVGNTQMPADAFEELLAELDDFDLCDGVFLAIAKVTGNRLDAANEPEACRTVTLVWHSGGIIGNGGFRYLFEGDFNGDPGYLITADAYRRIGANEDYAAFCAALAIFPMSRLPLNIDDRLRMYDAHPEERRQDIDNRFFSAADTRQKLLAKFIRFNKEAIRKFVVYKD
jgi:hypothetical protein